jgi:hypothetical protein
VGSNDCTSGTNPNERECLAVSHAIVAEKNQAQGRTGLAVGNWSHVPGGCSIQSGGDWAAYYNRRPEGLNDGTFRMSCSGPPAPSKHYHLEPEGSNNCTSGTNPNERECLAVSRAIAAEKNQTVGRTYLIAGSWRHVPTGCSTQTGGDWAAHFNRRHGGSNSGDYSMTCSGPPAPPKQYHLAPVGSNDCTSGTNPKELECLAATRAIVAEKNQRVGRRGLIAGSLSGVPAGCSIQTGGDWAAHYNRRPDGFNRGAHYRMICSGPPAPSKQYHVEPVGSDTCTSGTNPNERECLAASHAIAAEKNQTVGRNYLIAGSWSHVPTGCSTQSGGDWTAHYNRRPEGLKNGAYGMVCSGPPALPNP